MYKNGWAFTIFWKIFFCNLNQFCWLLCLKSLPKTLHIKFTPPPQKKFINHFSVPLHIINSQRVHHSSDVLMYILCFCIYEFTLKNESERKRKRLQCSYNAQMHTDSITIYYIVVLCCEFFPSFFFTKFCESAKVMMPLWKAYVQTPGACVQTFFACNYIFDFSTTT